MNCVEEKGRSDGTHRSLLVLALPEVVTEQVIEALHPGPGDGALERLMQRRDDLDRRPLSGRRVLVVLVPARCRGSTEQEAVAVDAGAQGVGLVRRTQDCIVVGLALDDKRRRGRRVGGFDEGEEVVGQLEERVDDFRGQVLRVLERMRGHGAWQDAESRGSRGVRGAL
jgi:hypothetical protein